MAKSRVEKNKALYDELELESFDLKDISETPKKEEKVVVEEKKQEIVEKKDMLPVVKKEKKHPIAVVEKKKKTEIVEEDDFVVEQPISYTDKLSVEEILRAKLEKQQKLKKDKKGYKKSPITDTYTPQMMQKNINQKEGVDIRKEANIRIKNNNDLIVILLVLLLIAVIAAGVIIAYAIW